MSEMYDEAKAGESPELEEQEVLREWSERIEALNASEAPASADAPAPIPEPEPGPEPQQGDEQDVLQSWSERLEAFRSSETEAVAEAPTVAMPAAAPTPAPTPAPTLAPAPAPEPEQKQEKKKEQKKKVKAARPRARTPRAPRGSKRVVGLKIGGSQIAAATVANNGSSEVVQLVREPLPAGVVVGGEVREPAVLGESLKAFFKKHKLPKKDVRLGIAANRIGVRTFALPDVEDPYQRENAILFRAQEVLPIPVHEAVLDYHVLDEQFGQESPRVLLVVAYRDLVDGFLQACQIAEIDLMGIDLEAFALLRALGPSEMRTAARVAVAIGHHRSTVAVSNGRVCEFTRVIDWGGDKLDVAVARVRGLTPQESAPIKHELSLGRAGMSPEDQQVVDAVLAEVHAFTRDLVSSLHYYQSQPGALEIADIALTGGTAHLPGLAEELQRLIGVDVHVADPLARVNVGKKVEVDDDELGSLTIAIGLGIED
jgi:type IV pilus assembly protein PilM